MFIPRFFHIPGYKNIDIKENHTDGIIENHIEPKTDKPFECHVCRTEMSRCRGKYKLKLKEVPIVRFAYFIHLWRRKGECPRCKKTRSEYIDFISEESPHVTADYSSWLGRLCEISEVTNAADFGKANSMTTWRLDYNRMKVMLKYYRIPKVTQITVDEVYARKKGRKGESRNKKFFTIISDLKTKRVIWVSESRDKEALDEFFAIIGPKACKAIKVVAMDQHESYRASVKEHCKNAKVVWDRFHLMQSFNVAVNDIRKEVFEYSTSSDPSRKYLQGKYRFIFLKKDSDRSKSEKEHMAEVMKRNNLFLQLELIKERLYTFFNSNDLEDAWKIFDEIGDWIHKLGFVYLKRWWDNLEEQWDTLSNYFTFKVTTALSEGINNVIKTLKRKAYGYRNMHYFRLKIMQLCGYLNSKYIPSTKLLRESLVSQGK